MFAILIGLKLKATIFVFMAAQRRYLIRGNMNDMEAKLDPDKFMRIHRSTIVNLQRIREVQPWFHGHHRVVLNNGQELKLSRYQKDKLRLLLGKEN